MLQRMCAPPPAAPKTAVCPARRPLGPRARIVWPSSVLPRCHAHRCHCDIIVRLYAEHDRRRLNVLSRSLSHRLRRRRKRCATTQTDCRTPGKSSSTSTTASTSGAGCNLNHFHYYSDSFKNNDKYTRHVFCIHEESIKTRTLASVCLKRSRALPCVLKISTPRILYGVLSLGVGGRGPAAAPGENTLQRHARLAPRPPVDRAAAAVPHGGGGG